MAKEVSTKSGRKFSTLKAAEEYFDKIRESAPINERISDPDKSDIIDIYERYCAATDYKLEDVIGITTVWVRRQLPRGDYVQTKAFAVVKAADKIESFSMNKALKAIAV
jgi:hypothetical protein